jgi:glycosyltransferase involved in cell wall biosynthesis
MFLIGMCPGGGASLWDREANPHLHRLSDEFLKNQAVVKTITQRDLVFPFRSKMLRDIDILYFHWAPSVYDTSRYQHLGISDVLHQRIKRIPKVRSAYKGFLHCYKSLNNSIIRKWVTERAYAEIDDWCRNLRELSLPIVWHQHDLLSHNLKDMDSFLSDIDRYLHRSLYDLSSGIVVHEESCVKPIFDFYGSPKPYAVGYMGRFNTNEAVDKQVARSRLHIGQEKIVLLYSGTSRRNRNPRVVIQAFHALKKKNSNLELLIASRGCWKYIKTLDTKGIHIVERYLAPAEMRDYFCAADYLVSDAEQYLTSAVIRSCMQYGLPVISNTFGTTADLAKDAIIPIDGTVEEAIQQALCIDEKQYVLMREAAFRNDEYRTWERGVSNILGLFNELIHEKEVT